MGAQHLVISILLTATFVVTVGLEESYFSIAFALKAFRIMYSSRYLRQRLKLNHQFTRAGIDLGLDTSSSFAHQH
jgi:ABC-type spermidine/putrescine transport system permease subunit II